MAATLQHHSAGVSWHENDTMARAAHGLRDGERVWLIDPFDDPAALAAVSELGPPTGVIQLLDRHKRDCAPIAERLGVPLHKVPSGLPGSGLTVVPVIRQRWWNEVALWSAESRALVIAEAVGTAPLFALGRPAGVHPMLRLLPPRAALGAFAPERLLVGHGPALDAGGAEALAGALSASRADIARLIAKLPSALRG